MRSYTFCIKNIRKDNNIPCTNPKIVWITGFAQATPCPGKNGCMDITVPDDISACIRGEVICDECGPGASKQFEICPCSKNTDCKACSTCVQGLCVSNCVTNEECDNGQCTCPPGLPLRDKDNNCVACNETFSSKCETCVNGIIVPKACTGACDPDTGDCVECISATNCLGRTDGKTCCSNNKCVCCSGFHYNPAIGKCEPNTDCIKDKDCPPCSNCIAGTCTPLVCPTGYICVDGGCKKICDCSNPSCPIGSVCFPNSATTCYCRDCSAYQCNATNPCVQGCMCTGTNCAPDPCDRACDPFNPCPTGCGCLNGRCVSCSTLSCNNCTIPGCICQNNTCTSTPCSAPCDPNTPCPTGCGCKDNSCADCNKPCNTQDDCYLGCYCDEKINTCKPNPCQYKTCSSPSDCGRDCTCYNGKCIPCSAFSCSVCASIPGCVCNSTNTCQTTITGPCEDTLELELTSDCKLEATLTKKDCCNCSDIFLDLEFTVSSGQYQVTGYLRSGSLPTDILIGSIGIANNLPIQGEVEFIPQLRLRKLSDNSFSTVDFTSTNLDFYAGSIGVDTVVGASAQLYLKGDLYPIVNPTHEVTDVCWHVKGLQTFKFQNECEYSIGDKSLICDGTIGSHSAVTNLEKLVACRLPIFDWYKDNFSVPFRREYGYRAGTNIFKSDLISTEGLQICHKYSVGADCTCTPITRQFSCNNDDIATNLVVYQPSSLSVTQNNACNNQITINEVTVCNLLIGAVYKLFINGVDVSATYLAGLTVNGSGKLFAGNLIVTSLIPITEVKLCYPCDDCNKCLIVKQTYGGNCFTCLNQLATLNLAGNCALGITATGNVSQIAPVGPLSGLTVDLYLDGVWVTSTTTDLLGNYTSNLPITINKTYVVKAVIGSCDLSKTFAITDCCDLHVSNVSFNCATSILNSSTSGCVGVLTMTIFDSNNLPVSAPSIPYNAAFPISLSNGNYSLEVFCNGTCSKNIPFSVGCTPPDFIGSLVCQVQIPNIQVGSFTNTTYPANIKVWVTNTNVSPNPMSPATFNISIPNSTTLTFPDPSLVVGKYVSAQITDGLGNSGAVKFIGQIQDCNIPCFKILAGNITCDVTPPNSRACVTVDTTGSYDLHLLDPGLVDVFPPQLGINLSTGVELCFPPAAFNIPSGNYTIKVVSNSNPGCLATKTVTANSCASYTASYNCTTGLTILQNGLPWTGPIKVDNEPSSSYYAYTGPSTTYLANETHTLQLFTNSNVLLFQTTIAAPKCCNLVITSTQPLCHPGNFPNQDGEFIINYTGASTPINVDIYIYDSTNTLIQSSLGYGSLSFTSQKVANGLYHFIVNDANIPIPNIGLDSKIPCGQKVSDTLNCTQTGCIDPLKVILQTYYEKDCNFNVDFAHTVMQLINQHSFAVNVDLYYKFQLTGCSNSACPPGSACVAPYTCFCGVSPFPGYTLVGSVSVAPNSTYCTTIPAHPSGGETCSYAVITKPGCNDIILGPQITLS